MVKFVFQTNITSVGSVFNDTRKVKVLSLPETIKEKSTFLAKAFLRELVVGGRGKPHVFLYKLIQKHHEGLHSKRRFFLYRFR